MRTQVWAVCLSALLLAATASRAEPQTGSSPAVAVIGLVLDHMQDLVCGTSKCAPATADERKDPPVSEAVADAVLRRGRLAGMADACGMDWQKRSFLPLMSYWRSNGQSVRQMAMIGAIHGIGMSIGAQAIAETTCNAEKAKLDSELDFKPS